MKKTKNEIIIEHPYNDLYKDLTLLENTANDINMSDPLINFDMDLDEELNKTEDQEIKDLKDNQLDTYNMLITQTDQINTE